MVLATSVTKGNTSVNDSRPKSKTDCEVLARNLESIKELPDFCLQFSNVTEALEKKNPAGKVDPFQGMWPGAAITARASRAQGKEHHAQIQRRLTTQGRRFSKLEK